MRQMINIDALAEEHYAKDDPAFHSEIDLEQQREIIETQVCVYVEHKLQELLDSLEDYEIDILQKHQDAMADTFAYLIDAAR